MTKKAFCVLYLDEALAEAIRKAPVRTDYEKDFKRRVTNSEIVGRILHRYAREKGLLKAPSGNEPDNKADGKLNANVK